MKVAPVGSSTLRVTFRRLNIAAKKLSRYAAPNAADVYLVKPAGTAGPRCGHHRHQVARAGMTVDHRVRLAVDAAVNRVNDRVAPPELWMLEERGGQDAFTRLA